MVSQQLLVEAGNYIIFKVDYLSVYIRVRQWLRFFFFLFLTALQIEHALHNYKRHDSY